MNPVPTLLHLIRPTHEKACAITWSPDGTRLAVGDELGGLKISTTEGRQLWHHIEQVASITQVDWSPDGKRVASASRDGTACIWDQVTGQLLLRAYGEDAIRCIKWSPNSQWLAYGAANGVTVIDATTSSAIWRYSTFAGPVNDLVWSPSGSQLAATSSDGTIRLINHATGALHVRVEASEVGVNTLCWSPNGQTVAAGAADGTVSIWHIETRSCVHRLRGHRESVSSISWSPFAPVLASAASDGTIYYWDARTGAEILHLDEGLDSIWSITFAPDGGRLAVVTHDGTIHIWDVSNTKPSNLSSRIYGPFQTYIARQAATVGRLAQPTARPSWVPTLPTAEGDCLGLLQRANQPANSYPPVALFPDGRRMVTGHPDGALVCWDVEQGRQQWVTEHAHHADIFDVAVSTDGSRVATASEDLTVGIWDGGTGRPLLRCEGHSHEVNRVCWSPDGSRVASGSDDGDLRVWDAATGTTLHVGSGHRGVVMGLAWSPDGQWLASGDEAGTVRIWVATTGTRVQQYQPLTEMITSLSWSPSGDRLLVGFKGAALLVLDAATGDEQWQQEEECQFLSALAWSPDERYVAAGQHSEGERLLKVWAVQSGAEVRRFRFPEEVCYKLAWSADGGYLASSHRGSSGGERRDVIRFWDVRGLLATPTPASVTTPTQPLGGPLSSLPSALAQLHRLAVHPPLALVANLLDLLGGQGGDGPLATLSNDPGILKLRHLGWPAPARTGLVALLLHQLYFPGWEPPTDATPTQVREALTAALAGETIPAEAPDPPLVALREAAKQLDDRLLALLTLLGPEAVAAEPGLPLRLLPKVGNLPALNSAQRRLLGLRVRLGERSGDATGHTFSGMGGQIGGIGLGSLDRTWRNLLPSQLVLPPDLLAYRHLRGELLLRTPQVAEPPRLRPTVLLLDVSPAAFGPVEAITRLAAFVVARSLRQADVPVLLVVPGDQGELIHPLEQPADLVELWTARTLTPIDPVRSLRLASAVHSQLRDESGLEPIILLLSHPWFGADEEVPAVSGLRGLFVHYPGHPIRPALASLCERWHLLAPGQTAGLADILGQLVG